MKRTLFSLAAFLTVASLAMAQTVTVDNTLASPNNSTTFNSIMMALHSFQASGKVTASTDGGGVGVNHANAAANVIQIVATGTPYLEEVRIDDRATITEQNVQDQDLTMEGIASGANTTPQLQLMADPSGVSYRALEMRTDANIVLRNMIFSFDPAYPYGSLAPAGGVTVYMVALTRLTATSGTPSTFLVEDCVFTGLDSTGKPLATNKDEAFIDRTADLVVSSVGGDTNRVLGVYPGVNQGILATVRNCVFYRNSNYYSSRPCYIFTYFGGIYTTWTETAGMSVESSILTYGPGVGIEIQSGGNTVNAAQQYVNVTGSGARANGLAGSPTVIAYMGTGNTSPGNGVGIFSIEPDPTNSPNGTLSGNWDNLWIIGSAAQAIRDNVLGNGATLYWNLTDSVLADNNKGSGGSAIATGWRTTTAVNPNAANLTNVTILGGNALAQPATGAGLSLSGSAPVNVTLNNVIIGKGSGAAGPLNGIANSGPCVVAVNNSGLITEGTFALGDLATNNTGSGSITPTNVLSADPAFYNTTNIANAQYLSPGSATYGTAGPGGTAIDGGRLYIPLAPPTPTPIPPTGATTWNLYN